MLTVLLVVVAPVCVCAAVFIVRRELELWERARYVPYNQEAKWNACSTGSLTDSTVSETPSNGSATASPSGGKTAAHVATSGLPDAFPTARAAR